MICTYLLLHVDELQARGSANNRSHSASASTGLLIQLVDNPGFRKGKLSAHPVRCSVSVSSGIGGGCGGWGLRLSQHADEAARLQEGQRIARPRDDLAHVAPALHLLLQQGCVLRHRFLLLHHYRVPLLLFKRIRIQNSGKVLRQTRTGTSALERSRGHAAQRLRNLPLSVQWFWGQVFAGISMAVYYTLALQQDNYQLLDNSTGINMEAAHFMEGYDAQVP